MNATHLGLLFPLYALFVDVVSHRVQNNIPTDVRIVENTQYSQKRLR